MKIKLAGYNIDESLIKIIDSEHAATPETISAAYARISRDPRDVPELRAEAQLQVKTARRSNKAIVFGMSHHSVAEHAYFNYDILQISRLALEELEARRIGVAYTEKSQRYIKLQGDYVIPQEFLDEDKQDFKKLVELQNTFYQKYLKKLIDFQFENHPNLAKKARSAEEKGLSDKKNRAKNTLEGWAKEDARYALSLATEAQLGMSFNARTLEHSIRKMRYSDLAECRELSQKLYDVTKDVAPSLIILSDPVEFQKAFKRDLQDDHYKFTRKNLKKYVKEIIATNVNSESDKVPKILEEENEKLIVSNNVDLDIAAAILHKNSKLNIEDAYKYASSVLNSTDKGKTFYKEVMKYLSVFDPLPREFEMSGDLKYELIVSASNYAQLKRHRLMTILPQEYDIDLGITIPESIKKIDASSELREVCDKSEELYSKFNHKYGRAAEYCLTNAHRRRVIVAANPRELYHFSRLREDEHAQWDVKKTAGNMLKLAKKIAPLSFILSGGKDKFEYLRTDQS